ncbi:MAG: thioredoxin domain-containing protein [Planctomycetota bacterium]
MSNTLSRPANRLAAETSPYLLQHAHNPVDWYAWGPEALERARREDRPIFLSIGYSACHWCHVMERESFENDAIARLMNEHFVNVKVDREERPDLDEIYMKAVQSMTGQGGWPMSVFLTPQLEPFFGGTYFPPRGAYGRPGFPEVLTALARAWKEDRPALAQQAKRLTDRIVEESRAKTNADLDPAVLDHSLAMLTRNFDARWGGFGEAPKFPHAMDLRLLLRHHLRSGQDAARKMALVSLDRMAAGGIYDQIGGGFHRYSTDEKWLIPHFEKMLYDNALLVPAYLEAFALTRDERHADVARGVCEWVLREMTTPEGGFASSQDADSEGVEGKFFVWTPDELVRVLGAKHGAWAAEWFGVTDDGNFEHGASALWRPEAADMVAQKLHIPRAELVAAMESARPKLYAARAQRVHPGTDDKVLASWNGLMISALALAHQVLDEPRYLDAARAALRYVLTGMRQPDGRLFATARSGRAHLNAYLDDYVFVVQALIDVYESDFDERWLDEATRLTTIVTDRFEDAEGGGFFTTAHDHESLLARLKNPHDGALPSGSGVHALNLLRLAELTGAGTLAQSAERTIRSLGALVNRYPAAFSQLLIAVDFLAAQPREIVLAGSLDDESLLALLREVRATFLPQRVVALARPSARSSTLPLIEGKVAGPSGARAYVCRNYACREPADTPAELRARLAEERVAAR